MPLFVKDFDWEETNEIISLYIPSKSTKKENVFFSQYESYLKVSYPPYIFEVLLFEAVKTEETKITISNGYISLNFVKVLPKLWGQLKSPLSDNKDEMRKQRTEATEKLQELMNQQTKDKKELVTANDKYALNEMITLENSDQQRIKDEKDSERHKAMKELEVWQQEQQSKDKEKMKDIKSAFRNYEQHNSQAANLMQKSKTAEKEKGISVRQAGHITVSFTERHFPTPERESTKALEDEWLKMQAERRKLADVYNSELNDDEKDPVFLRDRGNALFQAGNYQAAVNAYSHAIDLKSEMHSLFSNRAACHLKLGNYFKALEDSSRAIELLQPPVPQNLQARVRAHLRRGHALVNLSMLRKGLIEVKAAATLDPNNETIQEDIQRIETAIENDEQSDEEKW